MKDTPRTDAVNGSDGSIADCEELCELARTMERELARAVKERDEARAELKAIDDALGYDDAWGSGQTLSQAVAILRGQRDKAQAKHDGALSYISGQRLDLDGLERERDEARACLREMLSHWDRNLGAPELADCWRAALGDAPKGDA